ncbi:hypothetical protein AKJ40_00785 [candidate division MSBL1 archaeon SCGC-AAA259M10]|uniref:Uncharacterized protein n=2 Tax=candidate division MSBL1 TaxID=215777 RepID=A0A133U860_9EURY|nr:hypothetical protein AKJ61_00870 [candidate division MSBL1 archaeon SCGC-AAA259B11]KXB00728.1 hypothetical protein AKJ40_00785 [candidate division MSBL1 archaeon SCGC-AAA259M10]
MSGDEKKYKKYLGWPGSLRLKLSSKEFEGLFSILESHPADSDKGLELVRHFKKRLSEAAERHNAYFGRKLERRKELQEEHPEWFEKPKQK